MRHLIFAFCLLHLPTAGLWAQEDNLTQAFAAARSEQVGALSYGLQLDILPGQAHYSGVVDISVALLKDGPLTLDFSGKAVTEVRVDDQPVTDFVFSPEQGRIVIDHPALVKGQAYLQISFEGTFSRQGQGLHKYVDPSDGLEYLYTHLEPNDAHRVFPCFDQPDLRATYRFEVLAPSDWVVLGNGAPESRVREGVRTRTTLRETKPFSTYITQLTIGPYASFHDATFRYPLGLYCRQSLAQFVDPDRWFASTRASFDFFEAYFDTPYPFEKYDQILCPEYNIGAMENVAAVTWNDDHAVFRTKPTKDQLLSRDLTLYHEMAHMWFGDLVTMRWWNDLWLKESFATYMSYLAMEAGGIKDVWTRSMSTKDWALATDQLVNTHPILASVSDVRAAASIFDGITYGKGFAVLRQLDQYLGGDTFRNGCRIYFKRHAYQAVTLDEFIAALEEAAGRPLQNWVDVWLGRKGVNSAMVAYSVADGKIADARMLQMPGRFNDVLRPHTMDLALFYAGEGGLTTPGRVLRITYDGAETALAELNGLDAPDFIVPNYTDIDFVKPVFDTHALTWLRAHIDRLDAPELKSSVWRILWDMVHDTHFHPREFLEAALARLPHETNTQVLSRLIRGCEEIVGSYIADPTEAAAVRTRLFDACRKGLEAQAAGSDLQRPFFQTMVDHATTPSQRAYMEEVRLGRVRLEGLPITPTRQWDMILALGRYDHDAALAAADASAGTDTSNRAHNARLTLSAMKPDAAEKARLWTRITSDTSLSLSETFALASGMFPHGQESLANPYISRYFEVLPTVYQEKEYAFARRFVSMLFPDWGGDETVKQASAFLRNDKLDPTLAKLVEGQLDALRRKLRVRAFYADPHAASAL